MNNLEILYEDNHIIVVIKPPNVLSQSDITKDPDMLTIVKDYIKKKYNKPGNVYLGLIHRLDRPVGGIMVFAKTSKAASRLSKMFLEDKITKKYLAVVRGNLSEDGELIDYLLKLENGNSIVDSKGKLSKLKYKIIKKYQNMTLIEIELITGRHHQIRVQFSSRGYPLVGEKRYDNSKEEDMELFAYYLSFEHPVSKEMMEFQYNPKNLLISKIMEG